MSDSEEDVFFGEVTEKEMKKAAKLRRKTELYFPGYYLRSEARALGNSSSKTEDVIDVDCSNAAGKEIPDGENPISPQSIQHKLDETEISSIMPEAASCHSSDGTDASAENAGETNGLVNVKSLLDRFKEFGISEHDLENQKLTESILYTTFRESSAFTNLNNFTFCKTGENSEEGENAGMKVSTDGIKSLNVEKSNELDIDKKLYRDSPRKTTLNILKQFIAEEVMNSNLEERDPQPKQQDIYSNTASRDVHEEQPSVEEIHNQSISSTDIFERRNTLSNDISGVWRNDEIEPDSLDSAPKNDDEIETDSLYSSPKNDDDIETDSLSCGPLGRLSNVSSRSCSPLPLNNTFEEIDMLMKQGVSYIIGEVDPTKTAKKPLELESLNEDQLPSSSKSCSKDPVPSSIEKKTVVEMKSPSVFKLQKLDHFSAPHPYKRQNHKELSEKKKEPVKPLRKGTGIPTLGRLALAPPRSELAPPRMMRTPSPKSNKLGVLPQAISKSCDFKKPMIPTLSRTPSSSCIPRPIHKSFENIQSPVSAYINNSPSPILMTKVQGKPAHPSTFEEEQQIRAVWRTGERGTTPKKLDAENINPNGRCVLPKVKYTKAPCIKVDNEPKVHLPNHMAEKMVKLLGTPSPQVIKHEGRLKVDSRSPQYAAALKAVNRYPQDKSLNMSSISGDVSVCISNTASRTRTLGRKSPVSKENPGWN